MKKLILIFMLFIITGCYNYIEINDLVLINGIYIDYKDDMYKLKFDIEDTIESTGITISDAFRNFEEKTSKKAYYAHIKVLIITRDILNNHFDEVIEYFLRNNEIRNNFYLIVSDNINHIKSDYIKDIITNNSDIITSCLFKKVLTTYLSNKKLILPILNNNTITGSIIKTKNNIKELNIDDARLYKIIINNKPNIIYKNINIYHSKVNKIDDIYYIYLDAELKEKMNININKELTNDLERILDKKVILNIDINRNGQILNEE